MRSLVHIPSLLSLSFVVIGPMALSGSVKHVTFEDATDLVWHGEQVVKYIIFLLDYRQAFLTFF